MAATYPALATAAGTTVSISTVAPANHNTAGFDGITPTNWKEIGQIVNTGGFPKQVRDFDEVELLDGTTLVIPKNEKMEPINVEAVHQGADAGQMAVKGVSNGTTVAWFRWQTPSGTKIYCAAYVTGYAPTAGTSSDYVKVEFTIKPIFDSAKAGVVYGA